MDRLMGIDGAVGCCIVDTNSGAAGPRNAGGPVPEAARPPRLPDSEAPSGRVWPPVTGRILLHEVPPPATERSAAPRTS